EISAWFGKSKDVSLKELNYLASQKVGEGYELLGVMQKGFLVDSDIESLSSQPMQHISLKKAEEKQPEPKKTSNDIQGSNLGSKIQDNSYVNAKGAQAKKQNHEKRAVAPAYRVK
ncbi:MAG: hypothetical protein LBH25_04205, partial [Fibromonadaceae bacterium]|nr:hypothetical protein [Fibromonadaceae bacterium]